MSVDTCVVQEVWAGRVWAARPMKVVQDNGDLAVLWFPRGTRWKAPTTPPDRPWIENRGERLAECALRGDWVFRELEWDVDTLVLLRAGDWHAVWVSWLRGEPYGWYVNLQLPVSRTELGFQTMDLALDLIVDLDRTWRWKDEDELAVFVERGVFEPSIAERIRAEGLEAARRAERNEPPFSEGWHGWRPDPDWNLPELPAGWNDVSARSRPRPS